jgi:hypothetical protein
MGEKIINKHYKLDIPGQKRILSYRLAPSFRWVVGGRYSGAVDIKTLINILFIFYMYHLLIPVVTNSSPLFYEPRLQSLIWTQLNQIVRNKNFSLVGGERYLSQ